jgi:multidrug resistance efflux pump
MSVSFEHQARAAAMPARPVAAGIDLPWSRIAKIGAAVSVLAIGVYAVMADQFAIATDNAVVSAYSVSLRTPIDGVVGGAPLRVGQRVDRGATLVEVSNNRVDDQHLADLRQHLTQARAHLEAIADETRALQAMGGELESRSLAYMEASRARLAGSVNEAENVLAGLGDRKDQAERSLTRRVSLAVTGYASEADLDKNKSEFDIASHDVLAQQGKLASLRAQLEAVKSGVVSEPGSNDVAYSRQRADEILVRLADLRQQDATARADIEETAGRLASEQTRVDKLTVASMAAPTSGMIWKLKATAGERIGAGETIAQIVDCKAAFIIANVPQNRVPDIDVGSQAEFRLSGDNLKRFGRVQSVTGDATDGDNNLAALPFDQKGLTATVRIAMDPNDGECFVGRTARVVLPSSGPGIVSRIFSRFL